MEINITAKVSKTVWFYLMKISLFFRSERLFQALQNKALYKIDISGHKSVILAKEIFI
jgi:hypothetical protein